MIKKFIYSIKRLLHSPVGINAIRHELSKLDELKIQNGKIFSQLNKSNTNKIIENIQLSEFKVFSQWGDDGIIQFLTEYLNIKNYYIITLEVHFLNIEI